MATPSSKWINPRNILIAAVLALLLMTGGYYNGFTRRANAIEGQWKQVEVQYQRRFDLIPNLVEAAKGAQVQEQKIFGDIAEARTRYASGRSAEERVDAANDLEGGLSRLLAVFENYPQISSNQNILALQNQLEGTENRISVERRRYNEEVQGYNTSVDVLPGKLFAGLLGFDKKSYFDAEAGSEQAPEVKFGE